MAAANEPHLSPSTPISEQDEEAAAQNSAATPTVANSSNSAHSTSPRAANAGDAERAKRKRQPRNSACQSCAALKMKCIATAIPGTCERCSRMNRECLPAIPKPRKRRATDSFEPKGIPLSDLLENDSAAREAYRPPVKTFHPEYANGTPTQPHPDSTGPTFQTSFARALKLDEKLGDYFLHGVDYEFARQCRQQFESIRACFPFVDPPYIDPMSLVSARPVTLLAICTVSSSAFPDLRKRLGEAFRHVLACRCLMDGETSMDLMVGLLIYLAWNHQYYRCPQIYQSMCLLSGMATDLGLHKIPSLAEQARGVPEPELQKAYIGTYYLVSTLSFTGHSKPSPLLWNASLDHFASALYSSTGRELNLQPYIDLTHLLEDHASLLASAPMSTASTCLEINTKASLARLSTLQRLHTSTSLASNFATTSVQILVRGLSTQSHKPQSDMLMQLATTLRGYFDEILSRPPLLLHHYAVVEWVNLLAALLLITRLSSPAFLSAITKVPGLDSRSLADILDVNNMFDKVCDHMAAAPTDPRYGSRNDGLLSWLRNICLSMKSRTFKERADQLESPFEAVSALNRDRRASISGSGYPNDEGRFRAVNADAKQHFSPAAASPWSPTAATDIGFGLFGGIGLLDESFWAAFHGGNAF